MKICLVNTHRRKGGAAIACERLWNALNKSDVQTDLFNFYSNEKKLNQDSYFSGKIEKYFSDYYFIKERLLFLPHEHDSISRWNFSPANSGVDISRNETVKNASVIHLHWINHGFLSLKSLQQLTELNKPIVWTLHDMWAFTGGCHHSRGCENFLQHCGNCKFLKKPGNDDLSSMIHRKKEMIFRNKNFKVVTPSKWLANEASRSSLFANKQIDVIPNPLEISRYQPADKIGARKKLGLNPDSKIVLFIAANASSEYKGATYLKEAFELLLRNHAELSKDVVLVIVGRLKTNIYDQFPVKTILTGTLNDENTILDYYRSADIFLLPSLEENLPNTIMESMACGTPCVAFKTGGIPDMINHLENGYLADLRSSMDLMDGIKLLLSDKTLLMKMQGNARKKVVENYSYEIISAKYTELYRKLLVEKITA